MFSILITGTLFQEVNIMLNNLNSTESDEAVESIGDHSDFGMHGSLAEGASANLI